MLLIFPLVTIPYYPLFNEQIYLRRCLPFVGLDDFAFRKGHTYGTLICNLETHAPLALLPDRCPETITTWLQQYPFIKIVSRDGYTGFRQGITDANPLIKQVYDRWHFIRNAKRQLDSALLSLIPATITWSETNKKQLAISPTSTEKKMTKAQEQKWLLIQRIQKEHHSGKNKSRLAREYHLSRQTIQMYLKMKSPPSFTRKRHRETDRYTNQMEELEKAGKTIKAIYTIIQEQGYTGTFSAVRRFVEKLRRNRKTNRILEHSVSRKKISSFLWKKPTQLNQEETDYLNHSLKEYPNLQRIYSETQAFRKAIETQDVEYFLTWIQGQLSSRKNSFYYYAFRLRSDIQAVKNALSLPYSNGLLEGQINRLKAIKRITYGRAKLPILEKRILYKL